MAVDELGNEIIEDSTTSVDDTEVEVDGVSDTTSVTSALTTPDIAAGYNEAAADKADEESGITAEYESPYTTDPITGEVSGMPEGPDAEEYMTAETTVAGQLKELLESDSPLMQVTEANAKERAAALGMESSSMAIGAAQKALIETATPIAAQDAETAAAFKQSELALEQEQIKIETEAQVAGALTLQKAKLAEEQASIDQQWEATLKGLDVQASADLQTWQNELDKEMEVLTSNLNKELYQQQVDASVQEQIMVQSQDMLNNYQITVQQLLGNQVFLESMPDGESMRTLFDEMFTTVSSSIRLSAKAAGVYDDDFSDALDEMIAANAWT